MPHQPDGLHKPHATGVRRIVMRRPVGVLAPWCGWICACAAAHNTLATFLRPASHGADGPGGRPPRGKQLGGQGPRSYQRTALPPHQLRRPPRNLRDGRQCHTASGGASDAPPGYCRRLGRYLRRRWTAGVDWWFQQGSKSGSLQDQAPSHQVCSALRLGLRPVLRDHPGCTRRELQWARTTRRPSHYALGASAGDQARVQRREEGHPLDRDVR